MPRLTIDKRQVEIPEGATILDAAHKLGINIPTLCYIKGWEPNTSCMACVVKVEGRKRLLPACAAVVEEGMQVESETEEVHQARRTALELLLSDHLGDCTAPCQSACPAHMNIPRMIRRIAEGKLDEAIITIKKDIALPAVLGRICPAPCEKPCRRAAHDEAVAICLLKRYVADVDLASPKPYLPACKPAQNKGVAIVGAGPAGLSAAYYLLQEGFGCTIYDDHDKPGGMLRYAVSPEALPHEVLNAEIALIEKLGAKFEFQTTIGEKISIKDLHKDFDAVLIATGPLPDSTAEKPDHRAANKLPTLADLGLPAGPHGIKVDSKTLQTEIPGVFAAGDCLRPRRLAVRACAEGKAAAAAIAQKLRGSPVVGEPRLFTTHIGKLLDGEMEKFLTEAEPTARIEPGRGAAGGFAADEAPREARRCVHCDCRKPDSCRLRQLAQKYDVRANRYKGQRRTFEQQRQHQDIIYEPGKCISCGICLQITARQKEKLGLTFIGRGFNVRVKVPLDHSLAEGLTKTAAQCVAACPTGALAFKKEGVTPKA
ncbi:MAG: hypothetical protein AMJ79_05285 [Phycisphaerae bacterium SM23_30]|nr:MAG: hypothetical protein AMJ79_05285 [Phycisphaerae bacterium SM23_30]